MNLFVIVNYNFFPIAFTNILIENINEIKLLENEYIFHAGTKLIDNKIYSNGGRVLNFVCLSSEFKLSREKNTNLIKSINWSNGFYRKDIGYKVIE